MQKTCPSNNTPARPNNYLFIGIGIAILVIVIVVIVVIFTGGGKMDTGGS